MSFGFSIGDIIKLVELTTKTYNGWKNACGTYASVTDDLAVLRTLLLRVEAEAQAPKGYHAVVAELAKILNKYRSLSTSRAKNWDMIRLGNKDLDALNIRLLKKIESVSAFATVMGISSLGRMENSVFPEMLRRMDDIAAEMRRGNGSICTLTTYDNDDKTVWKEFRRDLIRANVKSRDIHRYKDALKTYILRLQNRGLLDEENKFEDHSADEKIEYGQTKNERLESQEPGDNELADKIREIKGLEDDELKATEVDNEIDNEAMGVEPRSAYTITQGESHPFTTTKASSVEGTKVSPKILNDSNEGVESELEFEEEISILYPSSDSNLRYMTQNAVGISTPPDSSKKEKENNDNDDDDDGDDEEPNLSGPIIDEELEIAVVSPPVRSCLKITAEKQREEDTEARVWTTREEKNVHFEEGLRDGRPLSSRHARMREREEQTYGANDEIVYTVGSKTGKKTAKFLLWAAGQSRYGM